MRDTGTGTVIYTNSAPGLDPILYIGDTSGFQDATGAVTFTFTIYSNINVTADTNVNWATMDGTGFFAGTSPTDYAGATASATIANGTNSITITVTVNPSTNPVDREFFVVLSADTSQTESISAVKSVGDGWIEGNGLPIHVTVSGDTVDAPPTGNNAMVVVDPTQTQNANFAITLTRAVPDWETVTVNYYTTDFTAKAFQDYSSVFGSVTFNPGESSKIVSVPVL